MAHAATAPARRARAQTRARARARPVAAAGRPSAIRWDRVGRLSLLAVLGVILLLYISPVGHWITQSRTAAAEEAELRTLQRENAQLQARKRMLSGPEALERRARELGMVQKGERAFVIEQPERRR